jgi:transposase-like protein
MDTRMTKRQNFSETFKTAVTLEALRGDKTVQEIAAKLDQLVILDRVW